MSRSYKKTPGFKDRNYGMKKFANKKTRKTKDIPNGKGYKKVFCSYDIADWNWRYWYDIPYKSEGHANEENRFIDYEVAKRK